MPSFFSEYVDDLAQIINTVMTVEEPTYDTIADALFAQKACKASIKA
ncbi:MAG: hypothetical protein WCJ81_03515 [bacterium]